jgi:hypothetical protein
MDDTGRHTLPLQKHRDLLSVFTAAAGSLYSIFIDTGRQAVTHPAQRATAAKRTSNIVLKAEIK